MALGPVATSVKRVTYEKLSAAVFANFNSTFCSKTYDVALYSRSVSQFNITAMRKAFDLYAAFSADPIFNSSAALLESYAMNAVKTADYDSTALPREERDRNIVM